MAGKTAYSEKTMTENILMLSKRNEKVEKLEHLLIEHFHKVCLISDPADISKMVSGDDYSIVVVTDSMWVEAEEDIFSELRTLFPSAKLLCLVDEITQELEMTMRSAGLIFLGSYDHFSKRYQEILQSVVKAK